MPATTHPTARQEDVPIEACRFAADFQPGPAEGPSVPFTALARSANPVAHWYWGERCIHDFAGMTAADSLPVDWMHDDTEVLGMLTSKVATPAGLQVSGSLIPFTPTDRASEVIFKSKAGIPYQASIFFDPFSMVVEDVPAGFSTTVNGRLQAGPLTIFREWRLLGVAICLYGVDGGTNVAFSRRLSGQTVPITRFSKPEQPPIRPAIFNPPAARPATPLAQPANDAAARFAYVPNSLQGHAAAEAAKEKRRQEHAQFAYVPVSIQRIQHSPQPTCN